MIKIQGIDPVKNRQVSKKKATSAPSGDFSALLGTQEAHESAAPTGGSGVHGVGSVGALLAMQSSEEDIADRKRALGHGKTVLDYLDTLRHGLLTGSVDVNAIQKLATEARAKYGHVEDPALQEVLREIEVRAEVELAKLDQARR